MPQPYNYVPNLPSISEVLASADNYNLAKSQVQAQLMKHIESQQNMARELATKEYVRQKANQLVQSDAGGSEQDWLDLMLIDPDTSKTISEFYKAKGEKKKENVISQFLKIDSTLRKNDLTETKALLEENLIAAESSKDPNLIAEAKGQLESFSKNPKMFQGLVKAFLINGMGADKYNATVGYRQLPEKEALQRGLSGGIAYQEGPSGKLEVVDKEGSAIALDQNKVKILEGIQKSIENDTIYKTAVSISPRVETLKTLLTDNSPLALSAVKTMMPKLAGEVGNLAKDEQERWGGSLSLIDRLDQQLKTWGSGKLTERNRDLLISTVKELEKAQVESANSIIKSKISIASKLNKLNKDEISPYFEDLVLKSKFEEPKPPVAQQKKQSAKKASKVSEPLYIVDWTD